MAFSHLRIHRSTLVKLRMLATLRQESIAAMVDRLAEQELERMEPATAQFIREQAGKDQDNH